jgi:hypothetical protein
MSDMLEFVEATSLPICPHCDEPIQSLEYCVQKLSFGPWGGFAWVIVLMCPHCHRIVGTQERE